MMSYIGRSFPSPNQIFGAAFLILATSCSAFRPLPTRQAVETTSQAQTIVSTGSETPIPDGNTKAFDIERTGDAQFRYAILMDVEVESLKNRRLYDYIGEWWGTPYRLGGEGRSGIDCSAFVKGLQSAVYGLSVPRVTSEQQKACRPVAESDRQEGDILFFRTGDGVMHVGVYLQNHRFVHASTSRGVVIDDMRTDYWRKAYLGTGRPGER